MLGESLFPYIRYITESFQNEAFFFFFFLKRKKLFFLQLCKTSSYGRFTYRNSLGEEIPFTFCITFKQLNSSGKQLASNLARISILYCVEPGTEGKCI